VTTPTPQWVTRDQLEAQLQHLRGQTLDPVAGLFGPDSMMWRIGRCHIPATLASGRALLLQIAHPWVTQGVDQHSRTRQDPIGRGRRTFMYVQSMTLGSLDQALDAAMAVHRRHAGIRGAMSYPAGAFHAQSEYRANEVNALIWVHATLWDSLIRLYEAVVEPLSAVEKERFYEETKTFALLFGIPLDALPADWPAFVAYNERMWSSDQLTVTPATLELTRFLFKPLYPGLGPVMRWMRRITAATLPPRLRDGFKLPADSSVERSYRRTLRTARRLHRWLPDHLRYNPTWFEARARVAGRGADPFTRLLTRIAFGRPTLVS
jgi:uncharacterized protein (DUF2236 family)